MEKGCHLAGRMRRAQGPPSRLRLLPLGLLVPPSLQGLHLARLLEGKHVEEQLASDMGPKGAPRASAHAPRRHPLKTLPVRLILELLPLALHWLLPSWLCALHLAGTVEGQRVEEALASEVGPTDSWWASARAAGRLGCTTKRVHERLPVHLRRELLLLTRHPLLPPMLRGLQLTRLFKGKRVEEHTASEMAPRGTFRAAGRGAEVCARSTPPCECEP